MRGGETKAGADLEKGTAENPAVDAAVAEEAADEEDEKKSVREVLANDESKNQPSRDDAGTERTRTSDVADSKSEV